MTSEMHVTISAAQQGGMHPLRLPCVFLSHTDALLTRERRRRGRRLGREKGINYCLSHSLRLRAPGYYHTKKKETWQILDAEISVRLNKLKIVCTMKVLCTCIRCLHTRYAQIHNMYCILWIFVYFIYFKCYTYAGCSVNHDIIEEAISHFVKVSRNIYNIIEQIFFVFEKDRVLVFMYTCIWLAIICLAHSIWLFTISMSLWI